MAICKRVSMLSIRIALRCPTARFSAGLYTCTPPMQSRHAFQRGSQNPQRPLFHFLGLCPGPIEPRLEVSATMFPSNVDGGFHVVSHDDEL